MPCKRCSGCGGSLPLAEVLEELGEQDKEIARIAALMRRRSAGWVRLAIVALVLFGAGCWVGGCVVTRINERERAQEAAQERDAELTSLYRRSSHAALEALSRTPIYHETERQEDGKQDQDPGNGGGSD